MSHFIVTLRGRRAFATAAIVAALAIGVPSNAQDAGRAIAAATGEVLNNAIAAVNAERYDEATNAVATLDRATLSPFERSRVEQILFNVAYKRERFDDARAHLQSAIDAGGLSAQEVSQARYQSAQLLMQEKRWSEGETALEEWLATAERPNPAAHYLLAVARYQSNDFDGALAPARAAVELQEQPQESQLSLLSALHLQAERYYDAVPVLQRLTIVAPAKKTYWLQLSSVYGQLEDYANSAAVMQLAHNAGLLTEDTELRRLADLLLFTDQPERAATVLEEGIANETVTVDDKLYEKLGEARFLKGVALFEQGLRSEARPWFEQARESPQHREAADRYLAEIAQLIGLEGEVEADDAVTAERVFVLGKQVESLTKYASQMEQLYAAQEAEILSLRQEVAILRNPRSN